jgi:hypothetical protein
MVGYEWMQALRCVSLLLKEEHDMVQMPMMCF